MEPIANTFKERAALERKSAGSIRSERDEQLQRFLDRLNPPRLRDGFKPMTAAQLAVKVAHIQTADLHTFFWQCEEGRSFGRYSWWSIKPQTMPKSPATR